MYVDGRNIPLDSRQEEQYALNQVLEEDWEFRFTVNYYLRQDQYNEEPYDRLLQEVDRFFAQKKKEGNND